MHRSDGNVARRGRSTAKSNTTYLIKHLQKHHADKHSRVPSKEGHNMTQTLTLVDALQGRQKPPIYQVKIGSASDIG